VWGIIGRMPLDPLGWKEDLGLGRCISPGARLMPPCSPTTPGIREATIQVERPADGLLLKVEERRSEGALDSCPYSWWANELPRTSKTSKGMLLGKDVDFGGYRTASR
jgi:hypothetical protein